MNDSTNIKLRRALVVDDDEAMVAYVSSALRSAGFQVESCGDGMTALERFKAAPFDAVVVDIRMPKLSGISFLKNLRLPQGSPRRIVLLSAMDDEKLRREAQDAGAVAYLVKPASVRAIIEAATGVVIPE